MEELLLSLVEALGKLGHLLIHDKQILTKICFLVDSVEPIASD